MYPLRSLSFLYRRISLDLSVSHLHLIDNELFTAIALTIWQYANTTLWRVEAELARIVDRSLKVPRFRKTKESRTVEKSARRRSFDLGGTKIDVVDSNLGWFVQVFGRWSGIVTLLVYVVRSRQSIRTILQSIKWGDKYLRALAPSRGNETFSWRKWTNRREAPPFLSIFIHRSPGPGYKLQQADSFGRPWTFCHDRSKNRC